MDFASPSHDDDHLRRVQSTGDLPNPAPSIRPSPRGSLRRHDGVIRLQRPEPLFLPFPDRGTNASVQSLDNVLQALQRDDASLQAHHPSTRRPRRNEETPTLLDKLLMACGLSGEDAKARREFISFVWGIGFAIAQVHILWFTYRRATSHVDMA